jgi:hypothetical protein
MLLEKLGLGPAISAFGGTVMDEDPLALPLLRSVPASDPREKDEKLRVFISYSRDDLEFADQLDIALRLYGFDTTLDRRAISGGEEWKQRLGNLIREADTVIFVLSPSSVGSIICAWEIEEAASLGKRIIPVVCRTLDGTSPPPHLRDLNYIYFYNEPKSPGSGFGSGQAHLIQALTTDLEWLREHTRLILRATEWEVGGRVDSRLLSGSDIVAAKTWVSRRPKDAPEPTTLHLEFIQSSELAEDARLSAQRKQLADMAHAQAEREAALLRAEHALKQAADAQRRRARLRNIALIVVTLVGGVACVGFYRAESAEQIATRTQARYDVLKAAIVGMSQKLRMPAYSQVGSNDVITDLIATSATLDGDRFTALLQLGVRAKSILWFDPAPQNNLNEVEAFRKMGFNVDPVTTIDAAMQQVRLKKIDLVITHFGNNPGGKLQSDAYTLKHLLDASSLSNIPIIIYSISVTDQFACNAQNDGFYDEVDKPPQLLQSAVRSVHGDAHVSRC